MRPNLGSRCSKSILRTHNLHFGNFKFDIFDAGGPQSHFILSVAITVAFEHLQCIRLS